MTISEFSDSFDSLLNSYASQAMFGKEASQNEIVLDEYEKSVILTQSQDIVVKSLFSEKTNSVGEGFDDSTRRQIDFSSLITTADLKRADDQSSVYDDRGILYLMPLRSDSEDAINVFDYTYDETFHPTGKGTPITDVLFILNEKLITSCNGLRKTYVVIPINYKEYDRIMSKPYAQPLKKQAWRLLQNNARGFDLKTELIPRWNLVGGETIQAYRIRYIRRPYPIILTDLPDGLNIDGFTKAKECELNPILHPEIVQKAVEIAASTRGLVRPSERQQS